jgi:hypothetical protein
VKAMKITDLEFCERNVKIKMPEGGFKASAFAFVVSSGNKFSGSFARTITFAFSWPK